MGIQERYTQMEALCQHLQELKKYPDERDELSNGDISDLENLQGLMQDVEVMTNDKRIKSMAGKIDTLAKEVWELV